MKKLVIGGVYEHYKGTHARVLMEAKHSETLEDMVIYIHLEEGGIWARPKKMFLENLVYNGKKRERFKLVPLKLKVRPSKGK